MVWCSLPRSAIVQPRRFTTSVPALTSSTHSAALSVPALGSARNSLIRICGKGPTLGVGVVVMVGWSVGPGVKAVGVGWDWVWALPGVPRSPTEVGQAEGAAIHSAMLL